MTVEKILEQFDALKSNQLSDTVKIGWLAEVEGRVLCQILGRSPEDVTLPKGSEDALTLPEIPLHDHRSCYCRCCYS